MIWKPKRFHEKMFKWGMTAQEEEKKLMQISVEKMKVNLFDTLFKLPGRFESFYVIRNIKYSQANTYDVVYMVHIYI